jgi:prephenate dehydrogenase
MPDSARAAAVAALPDRIGFLGFGLIGGSIALALREAGYAGRLVAWPPTGRGPAEANRRGIVDEVATQPWNAIDGARLIVLAGPPLSILEALDDLGTSLRGYVADEATITDVASTKARIIDRATRHQLPFVGGHPMAGREVSGFEAATADLLSDRPWVIVTDAGPPEASVDTVMQLVHAVGARPIHMSGSEHDSAVAAISHLPLLLSAALVETIALSSDEAIDWAAARDLAASGWRDMTRLARGDPEMGEGILATNGFTTAYYLREFREVIDRWIVRLEATQPIADPSPIRAALESARDALVAEDSR